jgi:hypothetical protein
MPPPYPNDHANSGEVKAMHTSRCASWASDHLPKEPLIGYERTLSARANGVWIPTSPQQQKKGLAHRRRTNAQIRDPSSARWSYLPLTRTLCKPLTCSFATLWRSPAWCVPQNKRDASLEPVRAPHRTRHRRADHRLPQRRHRRLPRRCPRREPHSIKRLLRTADVRRTLVTRRARKATPVATHP